MRTYWIAVLLGLMVLSPVVGADDVDLVNAAGVKALDNAKASIARAEKLKDVKRVGVASLEGDASNLTALVKSMLTKTNYDVVLTNDADWGPLLDEFARQVKREDLMLKETAHELRVQGVDAVLYGTVEKAGVEPMNEGLWRGQQATVRLMLNVASVSESNPGSLLWSEQVTGTASARRSVSPVVLAAAGGLVVLLLIAWLYRRAVTPR